jgi:hypothetical protein
MDLSLATPAVAIPGMGEENRASSAAKSQETDGIVLGSFQERLQGGKNTA